MGVLGAERRAAQGALRKSRQATRAKLVRSRNVDFVRDGGVRHGAIMEPRRDDFNDGPNGTIVWPESGLKYPWGNNLVQGRL